MKGGCLAYVAYCSLELATESFQVYQQCKKWIKITSNSKCCCFFYFVLFFLNINLSLLLVFIFSSRLLHLSSAFHLGLDYRDSSLNRPPPSQLRAPAPNGENTQPFLSQAKDISPACPRHKTRQGSFLNRDTVDPQNLRGLHSFEKLQILDVVQKKPFFKKKKI